MDQDSSSRQRIINFIKTGKGVLSAADKKLLNKVIGTKGNVPKVKNQNSKRVRRFLRNAR